MRKHAPALALALTLVVPSVAGAGSLPGGVTRLRPLDPAAVALVENARQQSPTIRDLVNKFEDRNLIVYVQVVPARADRPQSGMRYVGTSKSARFVLIQIATCDPPCREVELLGHELRHAWDVARWTWVSDDGRLQRMMSLFGWRDRKAARGYETASAVRTEAQVSREVRPVAAPAE